MFILWVMKVLGAYPPIDNHVLQCSHFLDKLGIRIAAEIRDKEEV